MHICVEAISPGNFKVKISGTYAKILPQFLPMSAKSLLLGLFNSRF